MSKRPPRIGSRQHWWLYGARDSENHQFKFFVGMQGHGKPPAVLRNLVKRGWMWAEKRQALNCDANQAAMELSTSKPGALVRTHGQGKGGSTASCGLARRRNTSARKRSRRRASMADYRCEIRLTGLGYYTTPPKRRRRVIVLRGPFDSIDDCIEATKRVVSRRDRSTELRAARVLWIRECSRGVCQCAAVRGDQNESRLGVRGRNALGLHVIRCVAQRLDVSGNVGK